MDPWTRGGLIRKYVHSYHFQVPIPSFLPGVVAGIEGNYLASASVAASSAVAWQVFGVGAIDVMNLLE